MHLKKIYPPQIIEIDLMKMLQELHAKWFERNIVHPTD